MCFFYDIMPTLLNIIIFLHVDKLIDKTGNTIIPVTEITLLRLISYPLWTTWHWYRTHISRCDGALVVSSSLTSLKAVSKWVPRFLTMLHSLLQYACCIPLKENGCWSVETNIFHLIHAIVDPIVLTDACSYTRKVEPVWYRICFGYIPQDLIVIFRYSLTQNVYV